VRYVETRPSPDLAAFVQCYWELEGGADSFAEPIFPDGRVEIVMHLGDRPRVADSATRQSDLIVVGQMTAAVRLHAAGPVHAIGVRFTPTGARAWLAAPLHQLTDAIECADSVRSKAARALRSAIEESTNIHAIEQALRATLLNTHRSSASVEWAVRTTLARAGRVSIDALAHGCGVSGRQLERQYLEEVGLAPKAFARTVRFQHALRQLRAGCPAATVAMACGFADQSHLAREFRRFAGAALKHVNLTDVVFVQDVPPAPIAD
jgi:AraC-like DNA-binding protein